MEGKQNHGHQENKTDAVFIKPDRVNTIASRHHMRSVLDVQPHWVISSAAHRMQHNPTTPKLYWQSRAPNWTFMCSTKYCVSTMLHRKVLQLTELRHDNVWHAVESATLLLHTACRSRQLIYFWAESISHSLNNCCTFTANRWLRQPEPIRILEIGFVHHEHVTWISEIDYIVVFTRL